MRAGRSPSDARAISNRLAVRLVIDFGVVDLFGQCSKTGLCGLHIVLRRIEARADSPGHRTGSG
jgi:hypothetical protein